MRNVLFKTNIFNLLVCQLSSKSFCNKLISRFDRNKISTSEKKSREETNIKKKNIRNISVIKIMRTNNVYSINLLMFCNSENENESLILSFFVKLKNIKS